MDIALFNSKVTFQKNTVITDSIGNHKNGWEDFYSCFATIGGEGMASSKEKEVAGTIVEDVGMTVTIRYCQKASEICSTTHRMIFRGEIYDITNVDHMNYKKKCLKFSCRKVRR
jgi:SPP1 family predicted phage head-tail adaptor